MPRLPQTQHYQRLQQQPQQQPNGDAVAADFAAVSVAVVQKTWSEEASGPPSL
jgi:hypothetical protein